MPIIQLPTIRLYYEERGDGAPILGIHGVSGSAIGWESAMPALAKLGRAIVYDRRSCTRSERPEPYEITSVAEHADDAAALLEALGATPAIVIGRSYGGEVATDLALRYPDRVRALVLLEGAPSSLSPVALRAEKEAAARIIAAADHGMEYVGETLLREVAGEDGWISLPERLKAAIAENGPAILAELRGGGLMVDAEVLRRIDKPTLLVSAMDSDEWLRIANEVMEEAIPGAQSTRVEGGHLIDPAHPVVLNFVRQVVASARVGSSRER